jgi:hypothetical protein
LPAAFLSAAASSARRFSSAISRCFFPLTTTHTRTHAHTHTRTHARKQANTSFNGDRYTARLHAWCLIGFSRSVSRFVCRKLAS